MKTKEEPIQSLDSFTLAYIEAMLWSTTHFEDDWEEHGENLDDSHGIHDMSESLLLEVIEDCASFQREMNALSESYGEDESETGEEKQIALDWWSEEQAGHDFCLTRNGHGAGFWDRGQGQAGRDLSEICKPYGSSEWYLGDDGLLYAYPFPVTPGIVGSIGERVATTQNLLMSSKALSQVPGPPPLERAGKFNQ